MKPCTVDSVEMLKPSARILQMEDKSMKLRGLKKKNYPRLFLKTRTTKKESTRVKQIFISHQQNLKREYLLSFLELIFLWLAPKSHATI